MALLNPLTCNVEHYLPQSVTYGIGSMDGTEFNDKFSLDGGLNVFGQSIGVAIESTGFDDVDGILGFVVCQTIFASKSILTMYQPWTQ